MRTRDQLHCRIGGTHHLYILAGPGRRQREPGRQRSIRAGDRGSDMRGERKTSAPRLSSSWLFGLVFSGGRRRHLLPYPPRRVPRRLLSIKVQVQTGSGKAMTVIRSFFTQRGVRVGQSAVLHQGCLQIRRSLGWTLSMKRTRRSELLSTNRLRKMSVSGTICSI